MSTTAVFYPIVAALLKSEEILGPNRLWRAEEKNELQERFLAEFFGPCRRETKGVEGIESVASWEAELVNQFLAARDFDIRLKDFGSESFGIASVFDVAVEWLNEGEVTELCDKTGEAFPAVKMSDDDLRFYQSDFHNHPMCRVSTTTGESVFMTRFDRELEGLDLIALADTLTMSRQPIHDRFGSLIFPMVSLKQEVDVSWLLNMYTFADIGMRARIAQALQQTSFAMDQVRARVRSAFTAQVALESATIELPPLLIDDKFLCWVVRPGLSKPLFVGHITQDDWKKPEATVSN